MKSAGHLKILHLNSHLDVGGITRYIQLLGTSMGRLGHETAVLSGGGGLEGEFNRAGMKTYTFPVRRKSILSPFLYFPLKNIAALIRREKFDVIHSHTRVTHALAYFLTRMTRVPSVNTYHGYFKNNIGRRVLPFWADRLVAVSAPVAAELKSLHRAPADRVRVVVNAIDLEASAKRLAGKDPAALRRQMGIPENAVVLCCVARLVRDKGHEILLRAAAELLPVFPDIYVLMAGDGREREALEKLIKELKLEKHAMLAPVLSDISEALAVTDIFVHPAFYREGFGLGIAEAMAAGKPVVLTNIPAINQIFRPGKCCVMAEPAEVPSLAGAIRFLLEAPGEKEKIAKAGYELVQSMCSSDRQAREMEIIYREIARV